jgi:hypothetical protein
MTTFNNLPLLSAQLARLGNDAGFKVNLNAEIPYGWETSSLVLEGILQGLQGKTVGRWFSPAQLKVIGTEFAPIDPEQLVADALFESPEVCAIVHGGSKKLFPLGMRTSCKYIDEYMESAFEGDIANAICMF